MIDLARLHEVVGGLAQPGPEMGEIGLLATECQLGSRHLGSPGQLGAAATPVTMCVADVDYYSLGALNTGDVIDATLTFTHADNDFGLRIYAVNPTTGYLNLSVIDVPTGARIDHVVSPDYELADGNGTAIDFGGAIGVATDLEVVTFSPFKSLTEHTTGTILVQ